ncbi:uncharacterized protein Dana_GF14575 [Drosophila ananassae]|uniref:WASH complex subunit CCDC53 homolog n=1 Tax=Drosophila ananassae TaxID=7217 RepID=B3MJP9_DROAN|nr:WASH complex subunit 3 [Drosophila ananassae]EDV31388.2 uncharacterized protein Dana_GF14575 [Drosophila ananassae]
MDNIVGDMDKSEIPPLNQKRILAFVNHFLVSTCTFLNEFALGCETKFVQMERQLQKTEASLVILEAKLASIPTEQTAHEESKPEEAKASDPISHPTEEDLTETEAQSPPEPAGVRACEDVRYRKFFKMLHVGVPAPAVKIKMQSEGLEPRILDTPDLILADGILE